METMEMVMERNQTERELRRNLKTETKDGTGL